MSATTFARLERAYLSGPEPVSIDAVSAPVTDSCTLVLSELAQAELADAHQPVCEQQTCVHCYQLLCEEHYAGDGAQPMATCEGFPAHAACHRQVCRDAECWYDG